MKKAFLLLLSLLPAMSVMFGQYKLEKEYFGMDNSDIKARTQMRTDENGNPVAILKIQIPMLQDAKISSPLMVGDGEYNPGEFIVYLGEGSKRVTVKHQDFEEFVYFFDAPLEGKTVYKLVLKLPDDYLSLGQVSVKVKTNVVKAMLNINGESYQTSDGEFLLRLKKGSYPYTLSTTLPGYEPLNGTLDVTDADGRLDSYIELQSQKKSNLHIANAEGTVIKIDGKEIGKTKGAIPLPHGRHYVDVALGGYSKSFVIDLVNDNEHLDADIRVPLTIVSPSSAEFTIQPLDNAMKPSVNKFKAGQPVKILGNYRVVAKAKGYEESTFDISAYPDMSTMRMGVPMTSKAHQLFYGAPSVKMDRSKSYKEFQKLVDKGDDQAMWEFGMILVDQNQLARGNLLITGAADKGHPDAALYTAKNLPKNETGKIRAYAEKALAGGNRAAHEVLGELYVTAPPVDYNKALCEFSQYNSPYSRVMRAGIVIDHPDLPGVDFSETTGLLESIEMTDPYYKMAQYLLGQMAARGLGMPKNIDKALGYWTKSGPEVLSQNEILTMAMANINSPSKLLYYVNHLELPSIRDDRVVYKGMSIIEFLKAAGQKLDTDNVGKAFQLMSKAYELGDRSLVTVSHLGKYYKDGQGTLKNERKAKEFLQIAADNFNDQKSIRWLGNIYENEKNLTMAEKYYLKGIELNDPIAKGYYATILYNKGKTFYPKAVELWTEAAKANHKQSIRNLIKYYDKVEKNQAKANAWRSKL